MTHAISPETAELDRSIKKYIDRCEKLYERAFLGSDRHREDFKRWLESRFGGRPYPKNLENEGLPHNDPVMLLHDDPLYTVARYFGMLPSQISEAIQQRAAKLESSRHW